MNIQFPFSGDTLPFRFGAEAYTWFMSESGRTHAGRLGHIINITARRLRRH